MSGQHHVKQDSEYVSRVDPAVVKAFLDAFGKPPVASQAAYQATISKHPAGYTAAPVTVGHHTGVPPIPVTIGQDMPLAPATYGFADRAAVDQWLEQALDSPRS